jgi:hypothetical protein
MNVLSAARVPILPVLNARKNLTLSSGDNDAA